MSRDSHQPPAQRLRVEYRPLDALIPYARNARTHSEEQVGQVAASIREFGWTNPILVDGANGVIAGHARIEAARKLGIEEVPVIELAGLSEAQKRAYVLADNRLALNAGWDEEMLALEIGDLKDMAVDLDLLGFSERELQQLLDRLSNEGGLVDPEDIPDLPEEPTCKPGDLWLLGDHRVLCGDATDPHDVTIVMDGALAACLWTDPPYGVEKVGGTKRKLTIANDVEEGLPNLLDAAFRAADAVLAPGAVYYIAHPDCFAYEFTAAVRAAGWIQARPAVVVWVKDHAVLGRGDYHSRSEPLLYGWKPGAAHRPVADRTQDNVWEIPRPSRNEDHPTAKPVELVARALRNSTLRGEIICDPFLGSGTTVIAAEQLGRRCFGLEIDPRYVDVAIQRWERFTGRKARRVEASSPRAAP